jgi:hypothetical protein
VDFQTVETGGQAQANVDFVTTIGTVTFAAGDVVEQIVVPVIGDISNEASETFFVVLNNAASSPLAGNVVLGDAQGTGTILDNDPIPDLSIADVTVTEDAAAGGFDAVLTLFLSTPAGADIAVNYSTSDGTRRSRRETTRRSSMAW